MNALLSFKTLQGGVLAGFLQPQYDIEVSYTSSTWFYSDVGACDETYKET